MLTHNLKYPTTIIRYVGRDADYGEHYLSLRWLKYGFAPPSHWHSDNAYTLWDVRRWQLWQRRGLIMFYWGNESNV